MQQNNNRQIDIAEVTHEYKFNPAYHFVLRNEKIQNYDNFSCTIKIVIKQIIDNVGDKLYDITFYNTYNGSTENEKVLAKMLHPMYYDEDFMECCYSGDGLPVNEVTTPIIKYLLTPIDKLSDVPKKISNYDFHCELLKAITIHSV